MDTGDKIVIVIAVLLIASGIFLYIFYIPCPVDFTSPLSVIFTFASLLVMMGVVLLSPMFLRRFGFMESSKIDDKEEK